MPAQLTLFPVRGTSRTFVWNDGRSQFAGREPESDIFLDDPRVSGRHALFQWTGGGWMLVDMRSKNGTYVNGERVSEVPLQSGDWISFGGLLARHERVREAEMRAEEENRIARRARCAAERRRLEGARDDGFWDAFLAAALELAGASRGFTASTASGRIPAVRSASGFARFETLDERFDSAIGAVESVLRDGKAVASMRRGEMGEKRRGTLEELGSGAVAAVALRTGTRVSGALCVEGRKRGGGFTDFDLELLDLLASASVPSGAAVASAGPVPVEPASPRETAPGPGRPFLEQLDRRLRDLVAVSGETAEPLAGPDGPG